MTKKKISKSLTAIALAACMMTGSAVTAQATVTTTVKAASQPKVNVKTRAVSTTKTTTTKTSTTKATVASTVSSSKNPYKGEIAITKAAPSVDSRVSKAFQNLGYKINVDPSVSYSGYTDNRSRKITLKKVDSTVYHELGHFLAFISGNYDKTAEFTSIFNQEKKLYTAFNKSYVTQNASEYFAESFKDYTSNPSALKSSRPKTYAAIRNALSKVTDSQIEKILKVYGPIWK